jgi:hypothetical protein
MAPGRETGRWARWEARPESSGEAHGEAHGSGDDVRPVAAPNTWGVTMADNVYSVSVFGDCAGSSGGPLRWCRLGEHVVVLVRDGFGRDVGGAGNVGTRCASDASGAVGARGVAGDAACARAATAGGAGVEPSSGGGVAEAIDELKARHFTPDAFPADHEAADALCNLVGSVGPYSGWFADALDFARNRCNVWSLGLEQPTAAVRLPSLGLRRETAGELLKVCRHLFVICGDLAAQRDLARRAVDQLEFQRAARDLDNRTGPDDTGRALVAAAVSRVRDASDVLHELAGNDHASDAMVERWLGILADRVVSAQTVIACERAQ